MSTETTISSDNDLVASVEDLIGSLEDFKDSVTDQDYNQALAEIGDIQSEINAFHAYIAEKAK